MEMIEILQGDALTTLRTLPDESVQCCVTSPPFWGLRDYGTAKWEGGDPACEHTGVVRRCDAPGRNDKQSTQKGSSSDRVSRNCLLCGARRIDSQLGLEKTPEEYVAKMVEVFREVRRVLKDDGTLWLNLGDSYAAGKQGRADGDRNGVDGFTGGQKFKGEAFKQRELAPGLKQKDLVGIPWAVAFALRADGWYLRSDIIWAKPNPMPESVRDRPTKAHEYIFLLTKSARYFYDADAIQEPATPGSHTTTEKSFGTQAAGAVIRPSGNQIPGSTFSWGNTRNKRSVWTVNSAPYPEAHFATYPPDLIKPCILAGSRHGDVILDPFAGSGTTGQVALELGRKALLIELNPKYVALIEHRTNITPGLALA